MNLPKQILTGLLLAALLLTSTGCPRSSTSQETFEDMYFDFVYDLKGLCIFWFRDVVVLNPHIIYITIPHLTSFSWTSGVIGSFGINNDQSGTDEFSFLIWSNGSMAFIDFGGDGIFNGDDIPITWNPSLNRFEIIHPLGGFGVAPGYYYIRFFPGLLPITGSDPCWDITVEMMGDPSPLIPEGLTVRKNRLMCMNACIMPHIGFADLAGLGLDTDFVLYNVNPVTNTITVVFFNHDGTPAEVTIDGVTSSSHTFMLKPNTSLRVRPSIDVGAAGVRVIWALGYGPRPIACALDFAAGNGPLPEPAILPAGGGATDLRGEAGIAASGADTLHVLNIIKRSHANNSLAVNTAFAIANPTEGTATVHARLLDENDQEVQATTLEVLAGKNQRAQFFTDPFPGFDPPDFDGTMILTSDTDIGVATLQTDGSGIQQASLPSANRKTP